MMQNFPEFQLVDNRLETKIELPCWANFNIPDRINNGIVQVNVGEYMAEKPTVLLDFDKRAIEHLLANFEEQQQQILEKLLIEYPIWQPQYGYSPEDAKHFMPDVKSIDDFKNLIVLTQIHILPVQKNEIAYYGYEFDCQWDVEHGMGCMFFKNEMVDFGMAESSFVIWKAQNHKDNAYNKPLFFDVERIKKELFQYTIKAFETYCKQKPIEKDIYALAYDYDTFNNVIYFSLNTLQDHQKTLEEYSKLSYMADSINTPEGIYEVKYSPGNYKHCAFDEFKPLTEVEKTKWDAIDTSLSEENMDIWYVHNNALQDTFFSVLENYFKSEHMKKLPIISDVKVIAVAHEQNIFEAEKLMQNYLNK